MVIYYRDIYREIFTEIFTEKNNRNIVSITIYKDIPLTQQIFLNGFDESSHPVETLKSLKIQQFHGSLFMTVISRFDM